MSDRNISPRAKSVWKQLIEWYGTGCIVDRYGKDPPPDWAKIIDGITTEQSKAGMSVIRSRHIQFPPTLPEFEIAMRPPRVVRTGPSAQERLCEFAARKYAGYLTRRQLNGPWRYTGNGDTGVTGVVIDADGDSPGYRVTLADIAEPA